MEIQLGNSRGRVTRIVGTGEPEREFRNTLEIVKHHFPMRQTPRWVWSDNGDIQNELKKYYYVKERAAPILSVTMTLGFIAMTRLFLRTNAGVDYLASTLGNPTAQQSPGAPMCWVGLSSDVVAPVVSDTTMTSEVTIGSLARTTATFGHTSGNGSFTLSNIFTSDQSIQINKYGFFNAATAGTLVYEYSTSQPRQMNPGDNMSVLETINF